MKKIIAPIVLVAALAAVMVEDVARTVHYAREAAPKILV
jgi:hypothetical protein